MLPDPHRPPNSQFFGIIIISNASNKKTSGKLQDGKTPIIFRIHHDSPKNISNIKSPQKIQKSSYFRIQIFPISPLARPSWHLLKAIPTTTDPPRRGCAESQEGAHGLVQGRRQDAGGLVLGVAGQVLRRRNDWGPKGSMKNGEIPSPMDPSTFLGSVWGVI